MAKFLVWRPHNYRLHNFFTKKHKGKKEGLILDIPNPEMLYLNRIQMKSTCFKTGSFHITLIQFFCIHFIFSYNYVQFLGRRVIIIYKHERQGAITMVIVLHGRIETKVIPWTTVYSTFKAFNKNIIPGLVKIIPPVKTSSGLCT